MKLPIILLATTALAFPASAADLGVLTSLDVCDELGLSGLTISSDSNCLQITGEVYYEVNWGDNNGALPVLGSAYNGGSIDWTDNDSDTTGDLDWDSYVEYYLGFIGSAATDVGTASAHIGLYGYHDTYVVNEALDATDNTLGLDYAYVRIGDGTVLTAGLVSDSIFNEDDDTPFGWIDSFLSYDTGGAAWDGSHGGSTSAYGYGGHAIQVVSNLGNGVSVGVALEDLGDIDETGNYGTLVGVVNYAGENLTAHLSVMAADVLDGDIEAYAAHAGFTATLDAFKLRGAVAANESGWWNALASAEATFDMFTLSATVDGTSERELGLTGAAEAAVTEQFKVKLAARYLDADTAIVDNEGIELRGRVEYAVLESLTLGAEVGHLWTGANAPSGAQSITDGLLDLTWSPGGDFDATASVGANSIGAYTVTFTASKSFQ